MDEWRTTIRRLLTSHSRSSSLEENYALLSSDDRASPRLTNGHYHQPNGHIPRRRSAKVTLRACCTVRRILILVALVPLMAVIVVLWHGIPPSFADVREFERRLPQHNLSLQFPEGEDGMYLRFPGHIWGHGFNNILQETLLMAYLAFLAKRSFVFEDYVWSHTPLPYTIYDLALRPARIPLNAFISGPTAGGPMAPPRAISAKWWDTVCPKAKRVAISSKGAPNEAEGSVIIDWWVDKLNTVSGGCVEVDSSAHAVFDRFLFGDSRLLSLWTTFSTSPILSAYAWSPLVLSAVSRNFAVLRPLPSPSDALASLPGLVAVHIRRGDYKRHCPRLAIWGSLYMGFNQYPTLPDKFTPPSAVNTSYSDIESYYLEHCLPTHEQIVSKLHSLREEHLNLKRVFILTNGWGWWLRGLDTKLREDGWEEVKGSLDLVLDAEQRYVDMAVDMAIAEKAEVFVGNGFSSLSSNIVMLRLAKGLDPSTIRFL